MAKTSLTRSKPDPVAIATKGAATSQIQTQESSDKGRINTADDDDPLIRSTKD